MVRTSLCSGLACGEQPLNPAVFCLPTVPVSGWLALTVQSEALLFVPKTRIPRGDVCGVTRMAMAPAYDSTNSG